MSRGSSGLEEHLLCSICLEVFTNPVSTPCDHNFCNSCITKYWDSGSAPHCQCPLCKSVFRVRPKLRVNSLVSEIASQVRKQAQKQGSMEVRSSDPQESKPGEVLCDACPEPKLKALKSCLVCLSSFCENHLQSHLSAPGLKKHQLMEPVDNLEDRMCPTHSRPLELYCNTDKKIVCMMCSVLEHKNHKFVPLKEAFEQEKVSLLQTVRENEVLVEQRRLKVQEIKAFLNQTQREATRETKDMVEVFVDIAEKLQKCLDFYTEVIEQTHFKHRQRGLALITKLQHEMNLLENRNTEAKQLQDSTDHLQFIQRCSALKTPAVLKEWSSVSFQPAMFQGTTARAVSSLDHELSQTRERLLTAELKRVQAFSTSVTLDPDTAHCHLVLSKDKRKVHHVEGKNKSLEDKDRFSESYSVLGKETFSSGRFYFEVQVDEKSKWEIGVAKESINRKSKIPVTPKGGLWAVSLKEGGEYCALTDPPMPLAPPSPPLKVGVFVDSIESVVSFHDVDSAHLLHSFSRCSFKEDVLRPYFSPGARDGKNSAPLILLGRDDPLSDF